MNQKLFISEGLELPDGKGVMDMPYSHYRSLARKSGYVKVSRMLGQLAAWNVNKDPKLSNYARKIQRRLKNDFNPSNESVVITELFGMDKWKKLVNSAVDIINKKLGTRLSASGKINDDDKTFKGNITSNVSGNTSAELYDACAKEFGADNLVYSERGKAFTIKIIDKLYLIFYADLTKGEKFDPSKINPEEVEGSVRVNRNINNLLNKRLIKFENGTIKPYSNKEVIVQHNNELWLVPNVDQDSGKDTYNFKDNPSPLIMIQKG